MIRMFLAAGRRPCGLRIGVAAALFFAAAVSGCNGQRSGNQALDDQFKDNPQFKKTSVAKFAGTVTIDGQAPAKEWKLFVILTDAQHLDENAHVDKPRLCVPCDSEGKFVFGTYDKADGVVPGKYVVTFVELHPPAAKSLGKGGRPGAFSVGARASYLGPDELKNLYNDPDKNKGEPTFNVDLQPPGKDNYTFDLAVAGKETAPAGPNAVTKIKGGR
jgi:hypothetical protein